MARSKLFRNAYEESPDEIKELIGTSRDENGQVPTSRLSRDELVREHKHHLQMLVEGVLPPRNFILPPPYLPSKSALSHAKRIHIDDLRISTRSSDEAILFRTIVEPYVHSSSITIVEDYHGGVARLTVCNIEDSMMDPVLPGGSVLAIKQPCWSVAQNGSYHIRVDHPSDLVLLDTADEVVPRAWRKTETTNIQNMAADWKKEGDMMFLKKKFRRALQCYEHGRLCLDAVSDFVPRIDIYRKRCNVNIILLRFDTAAQDLAQAITISAKSDSSLRDTNLARHSAVKAWLHNRGTDDLAEIASGVPRPLKDLAIRIKLDLGIYQKDPEYDLVSIFSYVSPLTLHVDAANYTEGVQVKQTSNHGRGLFAKRDLKAGDLVMVEKAFALPGYLVDDEGSECSLYSLGDGTATDRAGALLFKELVQKLDANPSLRKAFFDMDDGGYWKKHGWEVSEKEDIPVDVFRVEHIRRRNCFAAPLRAVDILNNPMTPVRNGFWIQSSYINHSCLPNCIRTFLGDILLLRATQNIAAGEEITTQYVNPELTFEGRQQKYKETWGFECDCRLCEADGNVGFQVERERMALFEELKGAAQRLEKRPSTVTALKKFAKRLRDLEALYRGVAYAGLPKLCLVHPTLFLTEAWRGLKSTDRMIESAIKLLQYFGIEVTIEGNEFKVFANCGLVNVECVRALKYLAEGYTANSQTDLASSITATARIWFRIITGTDVGSEQFLQL